MATAHNTRHPGSHAHSPVCSARQAGCYTHTDRQAHGVNAEGLGRVHDEEAVVHAVAQLQRHQTGHTYVVLPEVKVHQVLALGQHLCKGNGTCSAVEPP